MVSITSDASAATFQNMVPFIDHNSIEGKRIGNFQDVAGRWGLFLYSDLVERNQKMVSDDVCFPEFGTVSDVSPLIANAEAFRMTKVRKDTGANISPLVHFELYGEPLNGVKHANHLIAVIKIKCDGATLDPSNWCWLLLKMDALLTVRPLITSTKK